MFTTGIGGTARLLATCDRKPPYNSSAMMAEGPTVERERRECVGPEIDNHASVHRTGRFCLRQNAENSYKSQLGMRCSEFCGEMVFG